jgi:hypothetical protein
MDRPTQRIIYKNTSIEFLDRFYRGDVNRAVDIARQLLSDTSAGAFDVADSWAQGEGFAHDEVVGFRDTWLSGGGDFDGHDVDGVLRVAYREALALAYVPRDEDPSRDAKLVETFWLTGFGDVFEVHVHDGDDRVTMFMILPGDRDYGSKRADTPSYVVREGDLGMTRISGKPGPEAG